MNVVDRAKAALWKKSGLPHDPKGYVEDVRQNLISGFTPEMIMGDYHNGSGQEWFMKIKAIHSSAALAANVFGPWKTDPAKLKLLGFSGFNSIDLEYKCPTGLGGTPPNLDILLQSSDIVIGIESKLLEPLTPTTPYFSSSYSRNNLPFCEEPWWDLLEQLHHWPPTHLDAAQLVKHHLGLRNNFHTIKKIILLYLFWKPLNDANIPEYSRHAEDIDRFKNAISKGSSIQFIAMDYPQLWESWSEDIELEKHANFLRQRYSVEI